MTHKVVIVVKGETKLTIVDGNLDIKTSGNIKMFIPAEIVHEVPAQVSTGVDWEASDLCSED